MVGIANAAISRHVWETRAPAEQDGYEKWPVWARLATIVGLSALLWGGIISTAVVIFN